jgi:hypothetical protein
MFNIHMLDIYFWTAEDSGLFLDSLKRVLAPGQLRILHAPTGHAEHRDSMSPVVQQLEKAAISSPPHDRNSVSTTNSAFAAPVASRTPIAPPPSSTPTAAPMAYNPAAPAAPEPIAHREKTPPPPDAEGGTGLNIAAYHDQGGPQFAGPPQAAPSQQFASGPHQSFGPQPTGGAYIPGPPSMTTPQPGLQRANTMGQQQPGVVAPPPQSPYAQSFAGPPTDPNAHLYGQQPPTPGLVRQSTMPAGYSPQHAQYLPQAQQQQQQYAQVPLSPGFAPTGAPAATPSPAYATQPQQTYASGQQQFAYAGYDPSGVQHNIHQQLYRPDENAAPAKPGPGQAAASGRLEQKADKLEKRLNKWVKRFDK